MPSVIRSCKLSPSPVRTEQNNTPVTTVAMNTSAKDSPPLSPLTKLTNEHSATYSTPSIPALLSDALGSLITNSDVNDKLQTVAQPCLSSPDIILTCIHTPSCISSPLLPPLPPSPILSESSCSSCSSSDSPAVPMSSNQFWYSEWTTAYRCEESTVTHFWQPHLLPYHQIWIRLQEFLFQQENSCRGPSRDNSSCIPWPMYSRLAGCLSISLLIALSELSQWQYLRGTQWTSKIIPNLLLYFIELPQGIWAVLLMK